VTSRRFLALWTLFACGDDKGDDVPRDAARIPAVELRAPCRNNFEFLVGGCDPECTDLLLIGSTESCTLVEGGMCGKDFVRVVSPTVIGCCSWVHTATGLAAVFRPCRSVP